MSSPPSVRIAVVGDVHNDWSIEEDTKALQLLKVILVMRMLILSEVLQKSTSPKQLFLGIMMPGSLKSSQKGKRILSNCSWNGDEHVGYRRIDFPAVKLSVVGGRPFSHGGNRLNQKRLLRARYNVGDMDESAKRIYQAALRTPEDHSVVLLAHNGPTGLGSNMSDICGKDWELQGGDYVDPDLAAAISQLKKSTKLSIPLVVFGHMHKQLAYGNDVRKMIVVGDDNTVYLNGAIVPRIRRLRNEQEMCDRSSSCAETPVRTSESTGTLRAFTVAEILDGRVEKVAETWVSVLGENINLEEEHILFSRITTAHQQTL